MDRLCPKHPEGDFSPSGKCRPSNRSYQTEWRLRNPEVHNLRIRANAERARLINRQKLWDYLLTHPCVDCGIGDPRVLQADHIADNKRATITKLLTNASWATVLMELEKCEIRCANCYQIKTAERSRSWRHVMFTTGRIPSRL